MSPMFLVLSTPGCPKIVLGVCPSKYIESLGSHLWSFGAEASCFYAEHSCSMHTDGILGLCGSRLWGSVLE